MLRSIGDMNTVMTSLALGSVGQVMATPAISSLQQRKSVSQLMKEFPLVMDTKLKIIEILQFILDVRLDYRISCLLSIFKREFDESDAHQLAHNEAMAAAIAAAPTITGAGINSDDSGSAGSSTAAGSQPDPQPAFQQRQKNIDLESIGIQAEGIFDCESGDAANLDLDGQGGRTFLRVLLHLIMHDYPPLVSGALHLLFRHFSQRQEVLQAFRQVSCIGNYIEIIFSNSYIGYRNWNGYLKWVICILLTYLLIYFQNEEHISPTDTIFCLYPTIGIQNFRMVFST